RPSSRLGEGSALVAEAIPEAGGDRAHQFEIEPGAFRQCGALGIERGRPWRTALGHDLDQFRFELWFGEDAGRPQFLHLGLDRAHPLGAGHDLRADGNRARTAYAVMILEILVGIVEDDEWLVLHRR